MIFSLTCCCFPVYWESFLSESLEWISSERGDQNPGRSGSRTATSLPSLKVRVHPNLVGWDGGIFPKFFEGAKVTPPFGSRNLQFSFKADYHQADFLLFYFAPFRFLRRQV